MHVNLTPEQRVVKEKAAQALAPGQAPSSSARSR